MKVLNGKKYFDKKDVKDITALAKLVVNNPYDTLSFIYKADTNEIDKVVGGIDALSNTINWEFVTESAINLVKIENCANTLRIPESEHITYEEYNKMPVEKITKHSVIRYENWLRSVGIDILVEEFGKL